MNTIEVCLSPALFKYKVTTNDCIVVVIDVLRATTAFCAAFDSGVDTIVPITELAELQQFKSNGFLTAAERNGDKVDFADFGNSPSVFLMTRLKGKKLAYSTTNGTQAIEIAKNCTKISLVAFINIQAVANWLIEQKQNIVILCSGWKNTVSLEDTLCAGALVDQLEQSGKFSPVDDASYSSLVLWRSSKDNLIEVVKQANHYKRLFKLGLYEDLEYCFQLNTSKAIPTWSVTGFRNSAAPTNDLG